MRVRDRPGRIGNIGIDPIFIKHSRFNGQFLNGTQEVRIKSLLVNCHVGMRFKIIGKVHTLAIGYPMLFEPNAIRCSPDLIPYCKKNFGFGHFFFGVRPLHPATTTTKIIPLLSSSLSRKKLGYDWVLDVESDIN